MNRFVICPVREATSKEMAQIKRYVEMLERPGDSVYWPARDTDQKRLGFPICSDNAQALFESEIVDIYWNPKSQGSKFDLGMAFMLNHIYGLPIKLINRNFIEASRIATKCFEGVLLDWE